ncbi:uncharacterized protein N7496_012222 [Penicillium cataractarum]|uniref:VOC domain-containing protein n=1 Tax=Penicillium cataractarum TaxID=2100454 RepID=A0A9W9R7A9_9EURO|nr:uncharacterized protein N7496_012222 [Penicillium cataractarum]KAJ5355010.1 hypothetical protein N7496_012222 [Penicillium cataractarum]
MSTPVQNHVINHIGISVSNCEAAAEWYKKLFGFQSIGSIRHPKRSTQPNHCAFDIFPASLKEFKMAFLTAGNRVGFEIFEFIEPKTYVPQPEFEYHRGGVFHICVTDADPNALADRMVEAGGKRIGVSARPNSENTMVYVSDPWGNAIGILDGSYERVIGMMQMSA